MVRQVPLTRGMFAIVDDDDYATASAVRWYASPRHGLWYARGRLGGKRVQLHRLIIGAPDGVMVDHVNGDSLDCRRSNLRLASVQENSRNSRGRGSVSGFKGVKRAASRRNPWRAYIEMDCRFVHIGMFSDRESAARAYDAKARELFGEFARLNFPVPAGRAAD